MKRRLVLFLLLLLVVGVAVLIVSLPLSVSGLTELFGVQLNWLGALIPVSLALLLAALGVAAFGFRPRQVGMKALVAAIVAIVALVVLGAVVVILLNAIGPTIEPRHLGSSG